MRLPLPSSLLCLSLAALLAGDGARAASEPNLTRRWRATDIEANKPDENYKPPAPYKDSEESKERESRPEDRKFTTQSDAFTTAAEHAVYLQAYQMYYGPYGVANKNDEQATKTRNLKIKQTAIAIESCVQNKGTCGDKEQQAVLQALVQYNYGQELRRMSLTNSSNAEKMRSLAPREEMLDNGNTKAFEAMQRGSTLGGGQRKDSGISLSSGTGRDPFYQLDRARVEKPVGKDELEVLGPNFLKDYSVFVRAHSGAKRDERTMGRYYKFVQARPNVYTYEPAENSASPIALQDAARLDENIREQNSAAVQKIVEAELKRTDAPTAIQNPDPKKSDEYVIQGNRGESAGLNKTMDIYAPSTTGELGPDGKPLLKKVEGYNRFPLLADKLNKAFETAALEKNGPDGNSRTPAQSGASSFQGQSPKGLGENVTVNVTLSPERFDEFLNGIWPTSVERQKIISANTTAPAAGAPNASGSGNDPQP
ncbi:MAG: hypothetical protein EOP11_04530 [Proteobacteria bacterium]|nr:MAG: hypothetical protein EOP11_04530 [Pseudomonadota bacterium]